MSYPLVRHHLTYEELSQLPADGHRYELFDGEAYRSPSPSLQHQRILLRLATAIQACLPAGAEIYTAPLDVVLSPSTALQPDLLVVREESAAIVQDVIRGVPDLMVEVLSPSTEGMDRGLKMETYARHGVPEYWIADAEKEQIEVYRLDRGAMAYRLVANCRRDERVTTPLLPGLEVEVAAGFGV
jgi:Uma2 family endonuclease